MTCLFPTDQQLKTLCSNYIKDYMTVIVVVTQNTATVFFWGGQRIECEIRLISLCRTQNRVKVANDSYPLFFLAPTIQYLVNLSSSAYI